MTMNTMNSQSGDIHARQLGALQTGNPFVKRTGCVIADAKSDHVLTDVIEVNGRKKKVRGQWSVRDITEFEEPGEKIATTVRCLRCDLTADNFHDLAGLHDSPQELQNANELHVLVMIPVEPMIDKSGVPVRMLGHLPPTRTEELPPLLTGGVYGPR